MDLEFWEIIENSYKIFINIVNGEEVRKLFGDQIVEEKWLDQLNTKALNVLHYELKLSDYK